MRIGLFGGSFNPPHQGHRLASLIALRRLGLDRCWWLVTPGNPLKENSHLPSLADRLRAAQRVANHPRILHDPPAVTRLMAFEDYGMRIEVRFWIADPMNGVNNVRSDVNRAIWRLFRDNGLRDIERQSLTIRMDFADFDDYWQPFQGGQGPVGGYFAKLAPELKARIKDAVYDAYCSGAADGPRSMTATAWAVRGAVP